MKSEKQYRNEITRRMKEVNTYNKSFEYAINVLARTMRDYEETIDKFELSGAHMIIKHTNKNGSTNIVKNPLYLALEKLRDDVVSYSRELGLTPAGLKKLNDELSARKGNSKLGEVLSELSGR